MSAVPERYTHTHWIVDKAVQFLGERDPENPFFLWMVFEAPHSPYDPPEPYDRMYDNFSIPDPVVGDWVGTEDDPIPFLQKRVSHKYANLNEDMVRETRRRYYGQISHIDYQLGRFLGELRTRGLYDNTVIVFTADHGDHIGDHGLFGKSTYLKGSADVPMIIKLPSSISSDYSGMEVENPVLTADICPTFLELAGITAKEDTDGISLMNSIRGDTGERIVCGEFSNHMGFASDGRYKYIYYQEYGKEHLFNMDTDPYDMRNISASRDCVEVKDKLKNALIKYLTSFNRPMVKDGKLVCSPAEFDEKKVKSQNPFAWRGPMRYGRGYNG